MQCIGQTKSYFQVKVHVCMFMLLLLLNVNNCHFTFFCMKQLVPGVPDMLIFK